MILESGSSFSTAELLAAMSEARNRHTLLVVTAQIQLALILHQAKPQLIEPAASAQNVAREALMRREINSHVERIAKCFQRQRVAVCVETPRDRFEASGLARLHAEAKRFRMSSIEDAEC